MKTRRAEVTERGFVLRGHTVKILADYDGLQGTYQTCTGDWQEGHIEVTMMRADGSTRRIVFCQGEWERVCDPLLHGGGEESWLIRRASSVHEWSALYTHPATLERVEAAQKRYQKLKAQIRALQREESARKAFTWLRLCGKPFCSAIVPWTGKGVAA